MKVVFIGSFFIDNLASNFKKNSKGAMANANNALQHAFLEGFERLNCNIEAFSLPQISSYPRGYKIPYIPFGMDFKHKNYKSLGFINLVLVKHICRYIALRNAVKKYACYKDTLVFVIYDLYYPFIKPIIELKRKNRNIKICVIVPDLIEHTGGKSNLLYSIYGNYMESKLQTVLNDIDYFSLICKQMKDKLGIQDHFCVIEGICNNTEYELYKSVNSPIKTEEIFTIFYSGAIDKRNGVVHLINAFQLLCATNYRLEFCGDGYEKNFVIESSMSDSRIIYLGQLDRLEVLRRQKKASLLINPRLPNEDFTKYSFPSKTLEYFASGVPVLMYRLSGIPDEYFEYCYVIDDLSIESLAAEIRTLSNIGTDRLRKKGELAKEFVLTNKIPEKQVQKLLKLINENNY